MTSNELEKMNAETFKLLNEASKLRAEESKLVAEQMKLWLEGAKLHRERAWYPFVLMTSALVAGAALAKFFM